jgi:hypothetical protein
VSASYRSGGSLIPDSAFVPERDPRDRSQDAARDEAFRTREIPLDAEGKRRRIEPPVVVMGVVLPRTPAPERRERREPERESAMPPRREGTPAAEDRRATLRARLAIPATNAELADEFPWYASNAGNMLLRADCAAIGAVRSGNRLSPWTLPGGVRAKPFYESVHVADAPTPETPAKPVRVARVKLTAASPTPTPTPGLADVPTQELVDELGRRAARLDRVTAAFRGLA